MVSTARFFRLRSTNAVDVLLVVALDRLLGQPPPRLGRDVERLLALLAQPRQQPLAAAVAVDVGGVEEVHPAVERAVQRRHRLVVLDRAERPADRPGPEADCRNLPIRASERSKFHVRRAKLARRTCPLKSGSGWGQTSCASADSTAPSTRRRTGLREPSAGRAGTGAPARRSRRPAATPPCRPRTPAGRSPRTAASSPGRSPGGRRTTAGSIRHGSPGRRAIRLPPHRSPCSRGGRLGRSAQRLQLRRTAVRSRAACAPSASPASAAARSCGPRRRTR